MLAQTCLGSGISQPSLGSPLLELELLLLGQLGATGSGQSPAVL